MPVQRPYNPIARVWPADAGRFLKVGVARRDRFLRMG